VQVLKHKPHMTAYRNTKRNTYIFPINWCQQNDDQLEYSNYSTDNRGTEAFLHSLKLHNNNRPVWLTCYASN